MLTEVDGTPACIAMVLFKVTVSPKYALPATLRMPVMAKLVLIAFMVRLRAMARILLFVSGVQVVPSGEVNSLLMNPLFTATMPVSTHCDDALSQNTSVTDSTKPCTPLMSVQVTASVEVAKRLLAAAGVPMAIHWFREALQRTPKMGLVNKATVSFSQSMPLYE